MRLATLICICLALAACGKKGALDPPSGSAVPGGQPGVQEGVEPAVPAGQRFVLDPLI